MSSAGRLAGKIAVVTGGASGIGEGIVKMFLDEGARVVITDINREAGEKLATQLGDGALFVEQDVRLDDDWKKVMDATNLTFGPISILVQSAGISRPGNVEQVTLEDWRDHMAVNAEGILLGCQHAIAVMKNNGGGSIVNISSIESIRPGAPFVAYAASKAAVDAITKTTALHCAEMASNIRCNSIHPAAISTPIFDDYVQKSADPEKQLAIYAGMQPLNRVGTVEEVAYSVLFLASDESSFFTGHQMYVDGGALTKPYPAGQGV
jgi:NAD(P)-dependent dehydrogenase (short-subunit alcohol dehydrogenase family)